MFRINANLDTPGNFALNKKWIQTVGSHKPYMHTDHQQPYNPPAF